MSTTANNADSPPTPPDSGVGEDPEMARVAEIQDQIFGWRRWGPYVSERSWGSVREDYSQDGEAWRYLSYEQARAKAYRWGEDGIAGICDRYQILCFAPAFWNGKDPHLKERLFGVTPWEGNHGEDVKEYYYHSDNTPTHSYMRYLYKYPHQEYPYRWLVEENQRRAGQGAEFELLDTGIFDGDRYWDITVEYAKATAEDLCIRITAVNRGAEDAELHVLPHLWFRNTWSWGPVAQPEPRIESAGEARGGVVLVADDRDLLEDPNLPVLYRLGRRHLHGPAGGVPLFTDNETNGERVFGPGNASRKRTTKDAFHRLLCEGEGSAIGDQRGTKACIHYRMMVPAGGQSVLRLRLTDRDLADPLAEVDDVLERRRAEADLFYARIAPPAATEDERRIQRQALSGLLWSKQSYLFDVAKWLDGDNPDWPPPQSRKHRRNAHWRHLNSLRVMTVPDKWEYPWFAAWDLAFQCVGLALIDAKFAKDQLWLLLFEQFQHPNGQIPAYEWEFNDLNPPVHAWAVWRVYNMDRIRHGEADREWLERCFHKLLINFTSWVNKVDREGNNVFEGGFLGLDNITVIDRSDRLAGAVLEQSDATGWMGMFCLNLMRIALELAKDNRVYESLASKFFQHYTYIAYAMKHMGNRDYSLFDQRDGFFYDVLRFPDGTYHKFRVRSLVGLIPLFAVERLEVDWIEPFKEFKANLTWFLKNRREMAEQVVHAYESRDGRRGYLLTIVDMQQMRRVLERVYDQAEFLSPYGIRSLSKSHEQHPFELDGRVVNYEPAEAVSKLKGGNSNWRGPLWFPTSFLLIESLRKIGTAFGNDYTLRLPASDEPVAFRKIARDIARRMIAIFARDEHGRRPVFGHSRKMQEDPHWRDHLLFYEYFHGDEGRGLGASHQTGWTALVANLLDEWR
jgi:Mannosylglycerate hydrolase MGH1-like glycoside hydrolase domain